MTHPKIQTTAAAGVNTAFLYVTETANLAITLKAGGADVRLCSSNPLSTQDDVAAALVQHEGIPTFAIKGEDNATYYRHIESAIAHRPHLSMDDGADVVSVLHTKRKDLLRNVIGGTEETTTGVIRRRGNTRENFKFPVISVNDAIPSICSTIATAPAVHNGHYPRNQPVDLRPPVVAGYG